MKRKFCAFFALICTLSMLGCEAADTVKENEAKSLETEWNIENEENENLGVTETLGDEQETSVEETVDWAEYYQNVLANYTSEMVNQVIVGDFKGDGMTQAFIITTPQPVDIDDADFIDSYFCVSSLWYLDGETCQNMYLDSDKYSVICESGYIKDKMIIAIGTLTAWAPEQNYDSTIWYVSEDTPVSAGQMAQVLKIEDDYLFTFFKTYGEDEEGEYSALFMYTRYSFDDGIISYVDSYIE